MRMSQLKYELFDSGFHNLVDSMWVGRDERAGIHLLSLRGSKLWSNLGRRTFGGNLVREREIFINLSQGVILSSGWSQ